MRERIPAHYRAAAPGAAMLRLGLGMLGGACLAVQAPTIPPGWAAALAIVAAACAISLGRWAAAGLALGLALGGWALASALRDRLPADRDGTRIEFTGVIEAPARREPRRLLLSVRTEAPGELPRRVRLSWYEPDALPKPGERWRFVAKLQRPRGVVNPGGGTREAWLLRQRVGATGYASGPKAAERLAPAADLWLHLRGRTAEAIDAAVAPPRGAAVVTAITLGFRGGLDGATLDALARTGTGHLLAISGLHVGLAAAAGGLLAGWLARFAGPRRRPLRDWAALGALCAAIGYCLVAGMPVSARRAMLMTAAGLAALVARRGASLTAAFGAALILVLAADPLAVLDPGLWLSFGAVAAILAVVAGRRTGRSATAALLRIQLALAAGLLGCTAAWFGRVSLVAPLANLVAVPWFSFLVVPPALAGVALCWIWPAAGALLFAFAGQATEVALRVVDHLAALPVAAWHIADPGAGALLLSGLGAAWCLAPRPAPGRMLAPLLFVPLLLPAPARLPHGGFELRVLDVGHGLAVVVRTRTAALLYDAGPSWPGGDAGARSVVPALRALGVRRLDTLVISHGHADHFGGAAAVLAAFPAARYLAGAGVEARGAARCHDAQSWQWDGVRFRMLHPGPAFRAGLNDASCVLLIEGAGGRVLLSGDIERAGERALLARGAGLRVDLLVAPHHGSRTSSGPALVANTRPAWVVYSTGWRNRWGFPAAVVVERWRDAGARAWSTDRHGEVVVRFLPAGPSPPEARRETRCRLWLDC
jgi:competence protein ComEC